MSDFKQESGFVLKRILNIASGIRSNLSATKARQLVATSNPSTFKFAILDRLMLSGIKRAFQGGLWSSFNRLNSFNRFERFEQSTANYSNSLGFGLFSVWSGFSSFSSSSSAPAASDRQLAQQNYCFLDLAASNVLAAKNVEVLSAKAWLKD